MLPVRINLKPLDPAQVAQYVHHHMRTAAADKELFTEEATVGRGLESLRVHDLSDLSLPAEDSSALNQHATEGPRSLKIGHITAESGG